MVRHLVDYVAIAELVSDENTELDLDNEESKKEQGGGVKGRVVQRFPKENWEDLEFPEDGIVSFCQPGGWKTYEFAKPPEMFNFIFTNCEGAYTYVSCLIVYEDCTDILDNTDCIDVDDEIQPSFFYRSDSKRASLAASCTDLSRSLFGPKCLLLMSSFPFFSTFRECLCELYSRFIEDSKVMKLPEVCESIENMIAVLLSTEVKSGHPEKPLSIDLEGRVVNVELLNMSHQPPYTGTQVYDLVSTIGIGHTLQLISAMITDHKIMFISSNYSSLLSAAEASKALIYPLTIRHYTYIPILPKSLLEFVSSPTPYCTGIHVSSLAYVEDGFLGQTVVVDMDGGILKIPLDIETEIPPLPAHFKKYLNHCLKLIMDPKYLLSDLAFAPMPRKLSVPVLQDKEIRAAFMQFFAWMLAQYRCCLVVVRSHPKPVVIFNNKRFLAIRQFQDEPIVLQLFGTMAFANFIEDYGPAYRISTLFDDLVRSISDKPPKYGNNQDQRLPIEITELALRLLENERNSQTELHHLTPDNIEEIKFPRLDDERVDELLTEYGISKHSRKNSVHEPRYVGNKSIIEDRDLPAEVLPYRTAKKKNELRKMNNAVQNCLTAMFSNQIFNARKVLPNAKYALASHASVRNNFVAILAKIPDASMSLSHSQFDILAVLINTALEHDKGVDAGDFAIKIMPLTAKFCRQLQYGAVQMMYTCVQHHSIWQDITFWERAFYCIVQQHILEVFETMEKEGTLVLDYTNLKNDKLLENGLHDEHAQSMQQISQRALTHSALRMCKWKTLSQEQQEEIIQQEETTIIGQIVHFCSRILWLLVPLNINNEEDGAFLNNVSDVDHFDFVSITDPSSPLSKENKRNLDKVEIVHIIEKFVDTIGLKCQVEHYRQVENIRDRIPDLLDNQCESLVEVSQLAAQLPPVMKTTFLRAKLDIPPLVSLERFVAEPVHVYMLPVETETVQPQILPAEGALFLTNYRVIFRGYPRMSDDENTVIYRTMPLGSIYTLEDDQERVRSRIDDEEGETSGFEDGFLIVEQELKVFSLTCQLFRVGFFNEPASDGIEQFKRKLVGLRKVNKIVNTFAFVRPEIDHHHHHHHHHLDRTTGSKSRSGHPNRKSVAVTNQTTQQTSQTQQKLSAHKKDNEVPKSPGGRLKSTGLSHSPSMSSLVSNGDEQSENMSLVSGLTAASMFPGGSFRIKRSKKRQVLRYRPEFSYCEDFARLGFGGFNDIGKTVGGNKPWRLTAENKDYNLCRSYPAIMVVPSLSTDIELHNVARQFDRNRFPLITWKHPARAAALLMRSASIAKRGVMDKVVIAQKNITQKLKGSQARQESDMPDIGFRSEHTENYLNGLIHSIKQLQENSKISAFIRNKSKNHNFPKKIFKGIRQFKDNFGLSSDKLHLVGNYSASQATLSHIPEGDTMAAAAQEENSKITLFVIGRYHDLKVARMEQYNEVEMIGVEDTHYREVARSYELLMQALCPGSEKQELPGFWSQIEGSNWLELIQKILEISVVLVELMDRWGVSVLLALEDGSNFTAQISSLIQLLTDNHYRTIKGFNALLEKEWLSFGHRFSLHGRQTNEKEDNFAPIFLQFLDTVYQIHRQFPHCFEFNEYYLEMLAYHHCSMRFRTFLCDSEKKRSQAMGMVRLEDDSRTSTPELNRRNSVSSREENSSYTDDSCSFWSYIDSLKKGCPMFYNYLYRRPTEPTTVLRPNLHMASLELWRYYTRDDMTVGPTYEPDLWVAKSGKDKKAMPISPKEQVKEGLGRALISLSQLRFNRAGQEVPPMDSPWLQMLYSFYMDYKSVYKPSNTVNLVSNKTRLRYIQLKPSVKALANGKIRIDGHRFEKYVYDPFNEAEKLPCVICEDNPEIPSKQALTLKGLKCVYCNMTIHTICQLFVTRLCKKRETELEDGPIPRTNTLSNKTENRKSRILSVSKSNTVPDLNAMSGGITTTTNPKNVNESPAALNNNNNGCSNANVVSRDKAKDEGNIEGTLYKRGGILKQWRKWKFELNVKLKELRYYESANDPHNPLYIRKTIDLQGRVKVDPLSHTGFSGKDHHGHGFPFMIKTERKDLVLAADTKELRDIWMKRIKGINNT